ncbi:MAG: glycoside hydrolase family 32 protein [Bacteroidales bacterium]|nr:glycoside hydrolase family 32 protein [Bacteroidales bacterium]
MKRMIQSILLFVILATVFVACNTNKKDIIEPDNQTAYLQQHRPQFHFSPDSMWMNDPNGMVFYEGEYHLFYQHYPDDVVWGPMHWGHAISTDLVHWKHQHIALYPDSLGYIFSGSAVIDWNNTSGLQSGEHPPMIAIFTYHNMEGERAGTNNYQTQGIAFSNDKGRTWTKYSGNPVLDNPGIRDFRDPKVTWFEEGQKWIMTLAVQDHVSFYSSTNLTDWDFESDFGKNTGAHDGVWECPDLFPLMHSGTEKWVLLVSINPGGPNGGSATQYFVGDFDGSHFINENPGTEPLWIDYGKDNYAGVTWSDIPGEDGRRIFMGWMSNWQYATVVPTTPWRSAMTIPRELRLKNADENLQIISLPVTELELLRTSKYMDLEPAVLSGETEIKGIGDFTGSQYEIRLTFKLNNGSQFGLASDFGFRLKNDTSQQVTFGYDVSGSYAYVDRINSGKTSFSQEFRGIHEAPLPIESDLFTVHAFVDKASVEVFINNGEGVLTEIFFPDQDFNSIFLFAENGNVQLISGSIYELKSIW